MNKVLSKPISSTLPAVGRVQKLGPLSLTVGTVIHLEKGTRGLTLLVGRRGLFVFNTSDPRVEPKWVDQSNVTQAWSIKAKKFEGFTYNVLRKNKEVPYSVIERVLSMAKQKIKLLKTQSNEMRLWLCSSSSTFSWPKRIVPLLTKAKDAYYNSDDPIMTDEEYDYLEGVLKVRAPKSPFLAKVGATVTGDRKVKLPTPMYSLNKVKAGTKDIVKWINSRKVTDARTLLSAKIDGLSIQLVYKDGELKQAYTRGDGTYGQLVTHLVVNVPSIPQKIKQTGLFKVRGELVMPNSVFAKFYSEDYANPRNMVSGLINSTKNPDRKALSRCVFYAHELLLPVMDKVRSFEAMSRLKFHVVPYIVGKPQSVNDNNCSQQLEAFRRKQDLDIDGLVVSLSSPKIKETGDDNPKYSIAYKENSRSFTAIVDHVEWNASRYGMLKPKIILRNPVKHLGVTISQATAHNASYVRDNRIGPGAVVKMVRSGDVIPYIVEVLKPTKAQFPDKKKLGDWQWNDSEVDIVLKSNENEQQQRRALAHFFTTLEVDGVSGGLIGRLYEHGYTTVPSILALSKKGLLEVEGIQEKLAARIYDNIHEAMEDVELPMLCYASGVFGRSLGSTRFYRLWEEYGNDMCSWKGWTKREMVEEVSGIPGVGVVAAKQFAEGVNAFVRFFRGIRKWVTLAKYKKAVKKSAKLAGKSFVFTGIRVPEAEKKIKENGGEVSNGVSKNTTILVMKTLDSSSSKAQKAKQLGVKTMAVPQFLSWLKNQVG